ncbi:MAG: hypothetical protein ACE5KU_00200 [Nitrososphaerales archaeon]
MLNERRSRAQGTIVSEMLLLMIGILIAGLVLMWSLSFISAGQTSFSGGVFVSNAKLVEQISIDNVNFGTSTIYVRNYGDDSVKIVAVYVDGEEKTVTPKTISARDSQPVVTTESLPIEGTHSIRVATERGTYYEEMFKAP